MEDWDNIEFKRLRDLTQQAFNVVGKQLREDSKRSGKPLIVWENGKVIRKFIQ